MTVRGVSVMALITARRASKGLPGKNLRLLGGSTLVGRAAACALACRKVTGAFVSTDDPEVAAVCQGLGVKVPFMRPAELASDDARHIDVVDHFLGWLESEGRELPDYLLLLQPTSPLRTTADCDAVIAIAERTSAPAVVGVVEAPRHPELMYVLAEGGRLQRMFPGEAPERRRQDRVPVFAENGAIYLNTPASLRASRCFVPPETVGYVMPPERSVDVDTALDLEWAEFLLSRTRRASNAPEFRP